MRWRIDAVTLTRIDASWPCIVLVNVPVGVGAIALTPLLLGDSRAVLPHRHFDLAGACSVTAGLMLLVWALTRATSDGWGATTTLALLATSVRRWSKRTERTGE